MWDMTGFLIACCTLRKDIPPQAEVIASEIRRWKAPRRLEAGAIQYCDVSV